MSIGLRIKQLRTDENLNQIDFAQRIGVKQSPLSQMESGKILPSIETLSRIIREFNISYSWLIDGVGSKTKNEENVLIKREDKFEDKFEDLRKVKKMSSFESNVLSIAEPQSEYGKVMRKLKFAEGISISDSGAPFYDLPVSAGKVHELIDLQENPTGFISLPGINCDAYFPIIGTSFEPYIKAGDIIGINFIDKWENLDPDCIYLIITYDQRMLKRLMVHPKDSTLLIGISSNMKEFPIDKYTIRYIHKVTFCGRPV